MRKQREAFINRASTKFSVQQKPQAPTSSHTTYVSEEKKKKKKKVDEAKPEQTAEFNYKTAQSTMNTTNFAMMARIVDYMKKRHINQQHWALSMREVLNEMQLYDTSKKTEAWLNENLPTNPKLQFDTDGKFTFKPPYKILNRKHLLKQLEKNHVDGKGGILLSELNECLPNAEATAKSLEKENKIIDIPTQVILVKPISRGAMA